MALLEAAKPLSHRDGDVTIRRVKPSEIENDGDQARIEQWRAWDEKAWAKLRAKGKPVPETDDLPFEILVPVSLAEGDDGLPAVTPVAIEFTLGPGRRYVAHVDHIVEPAGAGECTLRSLRPGREFSELSGIIRPLRVELSAATGDPDKPARVAAAKFLRVEG